MFPIIFSQIACESGFRTASFLIVDCVGDTHNYQAPLFLELGIKIGLTRQPLFLLGLSVGPIITHSYAHLSLEGKKEVAVVMGKTLSLRGLR